jgi:hypothetical protein
MGLDIADNTHTIQERVGSYSGVHILRAKYIKLAIAYLESQHITLSPKRKASSELSDPQDKLPKSDTHVENTPTKQEDTKEPTEDEDENESEEDEENDSDEDKEDDSEESRLRLIQILKSWITFRGTNTHDILDNPVNYKWISGDISNEIHRWKMAGLVHFVNCSDCEGVWTLGQCMDILEFYQHIIPFKESHTVDPKNDKFDLEHLKALANVFEYAINNKGYVIRC